jgi:hypothetical protein
MEKGNNFSLVNVRKIVVGENVNNCKNYQIGSKYRQPRGLCKLTQILQNEGNPYLLDIYLKPTQEEGAVQFLWKSISVRMVLEVEYNSDF